MRSSCTDKNKHIIFSDIVFSCVFAAAGIFLFVFFSVVPQGNVAVITFKGDTVAELSLDKDAEITVTGEYENIITVENGEVFVRASTCRNQICAETGKISLSGQTIVCAPNGVVVTIRGEGKVDAVTQ